MTGEPIPKLRTPGVIARELGIPLYRVQYILRTRPHICPSARAGTLRLYDLHALGQIREALAEIESPEGKA